MDRRIAGYLTESQLLRTTWAEIMISPPYCVFRMTVTTDVLLLSASPHCQRQKHGHYALNGILDILVNDPGAC